MARAKAKNFQFTKQIAPPPQLLVIISSLQSLLSLQRLIESFATITWDH